ncbi:Stage V sporulation protein K [compost metagenome]|uniref:AAA family ATPase n=2 Tax=Paenibacillus sp. FSL R7-0331 TaxID=1536773 RepID=UPI0004F5A92C|nr:AAA family ATPase [Paenibacillus sp. FSL R7-0331]AIQ53110.1 ATPase AAA [Paenibacillus sp. FSL R7-0331]
MDDARQITINESRMNITFKSIEESAKATVAVTEHAAAPAPGYADSIKEIFHELDDMVGLERVKELVYEIYALLQIEKVRQEMGLKVNHHVYHMVFKGNPGTGKTTVARIVAKLFQRMGVLSKGHLIEVERADLVGEYIGHTAQKTRDLVKKALGGILFIDEAYSLARGGDKDFGKEAIDCMVKMMEDKHNDLIIILAGYPEEMDMLLEANTGLPSRFPIKIEFDDYSISELVLIAAKMAGERDYTLMTETIARLKEIILDEKLDDTVFSNARFVRNVIERAIRQQAVRLMSRQTKLSRQDLMTLLPRDITFIEESIRADSNITQANKKIQVKEEGAFY